MTCRICGNTKDNSSFQIREMQHCLKEMFTYFQCSVCQCIQIEKIPADIGKYYPQNYYSFNNQEGNKYLEKKLSFFQKVQAGYLIDGKNQLAGALFSIGYKTPELFTWLKGLQLSKDARILDIGCGAGVNLKRMYQLGYKNLTGVDPFIAQDYTFSDTFHIYKKDALELDEKQKFDCIMMHHSFEHMDLEEEVLKKSKALLNPGGKILIRIPVFSKPLLEKYGPELVSLDAPRHFYIHSPESMKMMCERAGLKITKLVYDANESSFWASEQYKKDICLYAENSYARSKEKSIFSKPEIKQFRKQISELNQQGQGDTAAFYIS